ncbi:MAG: GNAT family N-acetyltransferase [Clostridiaceae bacterium]|nr:GNAT family N-acetyltransferase [Clostridiaceae bacterium]
MERKIILKKKDDTKVEATMKFLNIDYIEKIMELQKKVYDGLDNKDFFSCSPKEEFEEMILRSGKIIGCVIEDTDELIAMGGYISYGYNDENYAYDLGLKGEDILSVGQIEATIVDKDYRGNKLQKLMCTQLEEVSRNNGDKIVAATAAPDNKYSVNTFLDLGYEIVCDKLKYGGLRRYVFKKELFT